MTISTQRETELTQQNQKLRAKIEILTNQIISNNEELKKIAETRIPEPITIDWVMRPIAYREADIGHDKVHEWFSKYFNQGVYYNGLTILGEDRYQRAVSIKLERSRPLKEQMAIKEFIPYIQPGYQGNRTVRVFESTLSEYGVYSVNTDNYELGITRYGSYSTIKSFSSIDELLEYVYKHHYY